MPASSTREFSRHWTDRLAPYHHHRNDEHLEALIEETARFAGLYLENDLSRSSYWAKAPLSRRIAVLLYLIDRGIVERETVHGRRVFLPTEDAETWILAQPALAPYVEAALELVAALRNVAARRNRPTRP